MIGNFAFLLNLKRKLFASLLRLASENIVVSILNKFLKINRSKEGKVRNPARSKPLRRDVQSVVCQDDLEFDVYWKDTGEVGMGPTVAVYVYEIEFLRFDCFGANKGHFHIFAGQETDSPGGERIWWREETRTQQIDRTLWELEFNLQNFLNLANDISIRRFKIDREALLNCLPKIRTNLQLHLGTVKSIIDNRSSGDIATN